jgi:hypothetical protein
MEKGKTPIQSTAVSLQSQTPRGGSAAPIHGDSWNVLICGDFGFASHKPQRVHISEWNDFMVQSRVILSGNVPDCCSGQEKQVFVDYTVDSMRDFSAPAIEKRAALLAPFHETITVLNDLLEGKITPDRAVERIEQTALPSVRKRAILGLLGKKSPSAPAPLPRTQQGTAHIDSLLAMVDMPVQGEATGVQTPVSDASSALFTAVTGGSAIIIPRHELQEQRESCESVVKRQVEQIIRAEFFSKRYASWSCLKEVIGTIGRTKGITVSVFSCGHESMADALAQVLQSSSEQGLPPDIVLIDDEYSFSNADISRLETMAQAASDNMCSVVAAIDSHDALFSGIESRDTLAQFFDDLRFLPFKKLRSNPLSRCLTLCGPKGTPGDEEAVAASAGWRVLFSWVNAFLSGQPLFECTQDQTGTPMSASPAVAIPMPIVKEAAEWGLTLFSSVAEASVPAATLVDDQAANPAYSRFGYNLAVNRMGRLIARVVAATRESAAGERLTDTIKAPVIRQLASYDLLSSDTAVSVEIDDRGPVTVIVDSEKTVCGYPLYLQVSV